MSEIQNLVENIKFEDSPEKAANEYFRSKTRGIDLSIPGPEWDQVPRDSEQILIEATREYEEVAQEREDDRKDQKERLEKLQNAWKDIENLQHELKQCFISTEVRVKELEGSKDKGVDDRRRSDMLEDRAKWLERRTGELTIIKDCIEDETRKLAPYYEFLESVARSEPEVYPAGAESVLQHYDRLCSAQVELDSRQSAALEETQALRESTQTFTAQALARLDVQQARICELRQQLQEATRNRDEWSRKLQQLRKSSQEMLGEECEVRAAMSVLYEQLWHRYHPDVPPPTADIHGQCKYIQLIICGLERLAKHRGVRVERLNTSLEPQSSIKHDSVK